MLRKVIQFRYYGENTSEANPEKPMNYPTSINQTILANGNLFNSYLPGVHLGIQTVPGTKFYLNSNHTTPVIVGATGIYELSLENTSGLIEALNFDPDSLSIIANTAGAYLIIDLVYETEED